MNQNSAKTVATQDVAEVIVPCLDLDQTLSFFIENLGFRVEMITPADNPNTAIVSGYGVRLCLRSGGSGNSTPTLGLIISIVVPFGACKVCALRSVECKRKKMSLPEPPLRKHNRTP